MVAKNLRSTVKQKCQKIIAQQTKNAKKERSVNTEKDQKTKGPQYIKMPKNQNSMVKEKCQKLQGLQSQKFANKSKSTITEICQKIKRRS